MENMRQDNTLYKKFLNRSSAPVVLSGRKGRRGFALLIVIVLMLLISFLASQLMLQVRSELKIAFNSKKRAIEYFLAEAGINLALFRKLDKPVEWEDEQYETFYEGYIYEETSLAKGKIRYYVVSESGKIDLNRAPRRLLEMFLEYHGLEPEDIEVVLDSLEDWRDSDNLHRLNGAERDTYQDLEVPYEPRNGPIEEPAEFFLVHGTEPLAGKFMPEDVFTVNNRPGKINFDSLSPAMLDFLVEGDEEKKQAYREAKELDGIVDDADIMQILGDERYGILRNFIRRSGSSKFYTVVAMAEAVFSPDTIAEPEEEKQEPSTRLSVLIETAGSGARQNYKLKSWKESQT